MAKESKEDRLVRLMFEQMSEYIHELKAIASNPNNKELDVERAIQTLTKTCLGFSVTNGYNIRAQEKKGKQRPDIVVYKDEKPIFVLEVKKIGADLNKSDFRSGKIQLQEYLYSLGNVPYGFLCNGYEWKLFDFTNTVGAIEIFSVDLRNDDDELDTTKKHVENVCYDFASFHESTFSSNDWEEIAKEATAFSPESLTKAILSSTVVKAISKEIRGEHEYKASVDVLFPKIYDLLASGLDDSLLDFNDVKRAELQKYMKTQMRASRRTKKVAKVEKAQIVESPISTEANNTSTESKVIPINANVKAPKAA